MSDAVKENLSIAGIWIAFVGLGIFIMPSLLSFVNDSFGGKEESSNASLTKDMNIKDPEPSKSFSDTKPSTFKGYECTDDCSGHEAGYEWAQENDVCDENFDGSNSDSFAEGVRAYAEDGCGYNDSGYEDEYYY